MSIYDDKLAEKKFQGEDKKGVYELSSKMATAPTAAVRGGTGVRDDVYDEPRLNMATTTSSAGIQGNETEEDSYEIMDSNALQGDNLYVIPDSIMTNMTASQPGEGEDTYDNVTVDTAATIAVPRGGGSGVSESAYDEPDNPVATMPLVAYSGTT